MPTLPAKELHRIAYNVALYAGKGSTTAGYTLWQRGGDLLRVTSCDDYFTLTDMMRVPHGGPGWQRVMPPAELHDLELLLRGEEGGQDEEVILSESTPAVEFADQGILSTLRQAENLCFPEANTLEASPAMLEYLALSPERMRKLSLIKPGGYPIDMMVMSWEPSQSTSPGGQFIAFRCGPTVRGAIAVLDREELGKLYKGEEIWH